MKARPCEFISSHSTITNYDDENHSDIKDMERIDIE